MRIVVPSGALLLAYHLLIGHVPSQNAWVVRLGAVGESASSLEQLRVASPEEKKMKDVEDAARPATTGARRDQANFPEEFFRRLEILRWRFGW